MVDMAAASKEVQVPEREAWLDLALPDVLHHLECQMDGLSSAEANRRLRRYGWNQMATEKPPGFLERLWTHVKNPLVVLLGVLALVSWISGDVRSALMMAVMVVLGVVLRYVQEYRADQAAARLKAMVRTQASVYRDGSWQELPMQELVPGDRIQLGAGDMIPADVYLLSSKDLFVNQAALTGESMPVEKRAGREQTPDASGLQRPWACFLGSNVESGSATALVVGTGATTYFGRLAAGLARQRQPTAFDRGINTFTWLMLRFILILVPLVFLINGLLRHTWVEAFLFALAVAVGLTPEMLPMIVSVNLAKGALSMSRRKVIVRRLNSIQNFGAMDVLCTDKTGTLTRGRIVLQEHLDVDGKDNIKVLEYGYLNSYHHTGLKNLMDEAVLEHEQMSEAHELQEAFRKIDEIPFDFVRKRMSVIVENGAGDNLLICKGAVEGLLDCCSQVERDGQVAVLGLQDRERCVDLVHRLNAQGFRVLALAYRWMGPGPDEPVYESSDESRLILLGLLSFFDPPKESAAEALQRLRDLHVQVKILTGDNEAVTAYICQQVQLPSDKVLLGSQIDAMDDASLRQEVASCHVFARLVPGHKKRIIQALQASGHVTGFLGDGINDAPALKTADIGISVNEAVDVAKESSDIILLETSLKILEDGVREGRRVFGNIVKYIKMAASSNFGNMFSVVGASALLPFLPMLPIQVLTNNLLYDFSQTTIPLDRVDAEWLVKPRRWAMAELQRFILVMGPVSSLFDYITFGLLWYVYGASGHPELFHTGWFVESLCTQSLIIHVMRTNRIPFLESMPSWQLVLSSLAVVVLGCYLTVSPLAPLLGFVALPMGFWLVLPLLLVCYLVLTQLLKAYLLRRAGGKDMNLI